MARRSQRTPSSSETGPASDSFAPKASGTRSISATASNGTALTATSSTPRDFVDRFLRLGVDERVDVEGDILVPLNEQDVRDVAATFREAGVEAIAVALLWSIVNDRHERRVGEILAEELPEVPVLLSSDVLPEIREWERTSATVLSAYVLPKIAGYLSEFESFLTDNGLTQRPLIHADQRRLRHA